MSLVPFRVPGVHSLRPDAMENDYNNMLLVCGTRGTRSRRHIGLSGQGRGAQLSAHTSSHRQPHARSRTRRCAAPMICAPSASEFICAGALLGEIVRTIRVRLPQRSLLGAVGVKSGGWSGCSACAHETYVLICKCTAAAAAATHVPAAGLLWVRCV